MILKRSTLLYRHFLLHGSPLINTVISLFIYLLYLCYSSPLTSSARNIGIAFYVYGVKSKLLPCLPCLVLNLISRLRRTRPQRSPFVSFVILLSLPNPTISTRHFLANLHIHFPVFFHTHRLFRFSFSPRQSSPLQVHFIFLVDPMASDFAILLFIYVLLLSVPWFLTLDLVFIFSPLISLSLFSFSRAPNGTPILTCPYIFTASVLPRILHP